MKVVGLDLAGKETNPTGLCILTDYGSSAEILFKDEDIIRRIAEQKPDLVAIDSPLDYPKKGYFRESDLLLQQRGFNPLSPKFPGMRPLVDRTKKIADELLKRKIKVIETFPKATEKILGLTQRRWANEHEYDALLAAMTAKHFLEGDYESLAGIIIPKA